MKGGRRCLALAALWSFWALAPSLPAQEVRLNPAIESQRAQRNRSQVLLADQRLSRRLGAALLLASQGKWTQARPKLLPALVPGHPRIQISWGRRETRDFHLLLARILEAAPPHAKRAWSRNLEKEALQRLARIPRKPRALRAFALAFVGTKASRAALLQALDLALEKGDLLQAETLAADLRLPPNHPQRLALQQLARWSLPVPAWPSPPGAPNGNPPPTPQPQGTPIRGPRSLGSWPGGSLSVQLGLMGPGPRGSSRYLFLGGAKLGVVDLAVASDPKESHEDESTKAPQARLQLLALPGSLPPEGDAGLLLSQKGISSLLTILQPTTAFLQKTRPRLFALRLPSEGAKTLEVQWSYAPPRTQLTGSLLATRGRIFFLSSKQLDPVTIQLSAHCLDAGGKLLWSRDLVRGAPLTKDLAEHRQEGLRGRFFRPERPILDQGRLYIGTGLGMTFCLDPLDGTPLWSFRYARLPSLGDREEPWERGSIAGGSRIWHCPSDSNFLYLLRKDPGMESVLQRLPLPKGSLRFFLGSLGDRAYFLRRDWLEMGPVRLSFPEKPAPHPRYDAPPIQPGERLLFPPVLTGSYLLQVSDKTLYLNEIARDLYYTKVLPVEREWGPYLGLALPTPAGFLLAGPKGPSVW
ncbi:MAG TPA: hypothetical protein ENK02_11215 [Planctomycetes bacterium]|nr:hypothetical protein [Planctomycetota bacterium]